MSNPLHLTRAGRAGCALAVSFALGALPTAAQAAPVDLGTAGPFVVLGGQSVTNSGASVLNGDLGVAPGTSLVGFGLPAVVNGATHANDAVAVQAQDDLTTAYDVAAAEPVAPADVLTGIDLGGLDLKRGAYRYASSAQLTGQLTLDAEGDPSAQFVFEIGSTLTTASASSVRLIGGASPCNVFWQVGSSATLGSTTDFQGNVMALADISLNNGASVDGRVLARTGGSITLINNVLDNSMCTSPPALPAATPTSSGGSTSNTAPGTSSGGTAGTTPGTSSGGTAGTTPGSGDGTPAVTVRARPAGRATVNPKNTRRGTATIRRTRRQTCTAGFVATVRGHMIKRVTFSLDGRRIGSRVGSPFQAYVPATPGAHRVKARVTFKDATRAKTVTLAYRACAAALRNPRRGPSRFTG